MPLTTNIVGLTIFLLVAYHLVNRVGAWRRLRHIPGPFWARWSHLWIIKHIWNGAFIDQLLELHTKYGPVVVLAPDFVSLSDPDEIKRIGKVRSPWGRARGYMGFRFTPGVDGDSILSVRDDKAHARMRAKLMPGYAGKTIEGVEELVDKHVLQLVHLIETKYITATTGTSGSSEPTYRPVEFSRLIQFLAIDIITSFAFNESFACLERDDDFYGYLGTVNSAVAPLLTMAFLPFYSNLMDTPALNGMFPEGGFFPKVFETAKRQVGERFGQDGQQSKHINDVLGTWVATGLTQKELINETVAQLTAGGETTSTGIRAAVLYLLTSPRTYQTLQREIDDALRSGTVTRCPVSEDETKKLPYLQAVVKESLRLFTPAAFFPKSSPNDEVLCGLKIPQGVSVEMAFKPALRTKSVFGDDADFFRPERWIEAKGSQLTLMDETFRFVFGGPSRWECLGKGLAFMELHKTIFELFRRFDIAIVNPTTPWKAAGTRIWGISDMFVLITKRERVDTSS